MFIQRDMIQAIKDIGQYQFNPKLESNDVAYNTPVTLFGKTWRFMDDYWMKHVHIKITDRCDAHCPFCIEKHSHIKENNRHLVYNLTLLSEQLMEQNCLTTVSITGGEPSLCDITGDIIDFFKNRYKVFLTINTNFHHLIASTREPDWLNISRHVIGNDEYCGIKALDLEKLSFYRKVHPTTKVRLQCVLHPYGLQNIDSIKSFIERYVGIVDDISFRRLINITDQAPDDDLFQQLKHFLYDHASFVEQVLKDYYVYETWNYKGLDITLSHSNMKLLHDLEETEDDRIIREIVVHPDGLISGSWYRNKKIIAL